MGPALFLALFCVLASVPVGAQSGSAAAPDLYRLQQQITTLTAGIDSTGHLVTAALLLAFLSDGVVEVQSAAGELFGFDRTRSISTLSAEQIAAAQAHGQHDDIAVLTLTFAPVEVLHA